MRKIKKKIIAFLSAALTVSLLLQSSMVLAANDSKTDQLANDSETILEDPLYSVSIFHSDMGTAKADDSHFVLTKQDMDCYEYHANETVTIQITPDEEKEVKDIEIKTESEVKLTPEIKEQAYTYTFNMPEENVLVTAEYVDKISDQNQITEAAEEEVESADETEVVTDKETAEPVENDTLAEENVNISVAPESEEEIADNKIITENEFSDAVKENRIISPAAINLAANPKANTITYLGPITYKGVTVGQFNINGHIAFCMEHNKTSPPTGTSFAEQIYNDANIAKVLYYGYSGHGQWSGFSGDAAQGIVVTTCALSYYYAGPGSLGGNPFLADNWLAPLGDFLRFIQTAPSPNVTQFTLSTSYTESYLSEDKTYQRTENITLNADQQNTVTIPLPENVTLVNVSTGVESKGSAMVSGGQTFYLKAPLNMNGTWETGNLYGSMGKLNAVLCITGSPGLQNLGYGQWATDPDHYINLSVKWVQMGDIKITKFLGSDDEIKTPAVGAEFTLTHQVTGEKVVITVDETGTATTEDRENYPIGRLIGGDWLIEETKTPEGFKTIEPFTVTVYGQGQVFSFIAEDKEIYAAIQVIKLDESTGKEIVASGATFKIVDENGNDVVFTDYSPHKETFTEFTTDENGQFVLPNQLKFGKYKLVEVEAPEGYLLADPIDFEVSQMSDWETPLVLKAEDKNVMGKIQIIKTDEETGEVLADTTFEVTAAEDIITGDGTIRAKAGEVVDTLVTNQEGKAESKELYLGKYKIKEIEAKTGYVCSQEEQIVELSYQDQNTAVVYGTVELTNRPTTIVITKKTMGKDNTLAGVTFNIWNKGMESEVDPEFGVTESYTTDENGQIILKYLAAGSYRIQETATIPGYILDDTIYDFTVDENGMVIVENEEEPQESGSIMVENDFTKIQISKQDATTGKELPGAELELIRKDSGKIIDKWTSGEEPHYIDTLETGDYILRETIAPKGYKVAQDVTFTVEPTGEVQKVVMKDELKEGTIRTSIPHDFRNGSSGNVKTGDQSMIWGPIAVLFIAVATILFCVYKRKAGNHEEV